MEHPQSHNVISAEMTFQHHTDDAEFKKRVRKTTILLSVITVIELGNRVKHLYYSQGR